MVLVRWLESPELSTVPPPSSIAGGGRRDRWRSDLRHLRHLQWEYIHRQERGQRVTVPRYDVVPLPSVQRRVAIVPNYELDPSASRGLFLLNDLVDWEHAMGSMLCPSAAARAAGCCPGGNCRCDQCSVRALLASCLCAATAAWPIPERYMRYLPGKQCLLPTCCGGSSR